MVTTRFTTADELFALGSDAPFELIQGELVRVSPSALKSNLVLNYINWQLYGFVLTHNLGSVSVAEAGYLVETKPDTVVAPDIAFVARHRMPSPVPDHGFVRLRPDLIVEVISPSDERGDIKTKQALYDRIAVPMVWWIDPRREIASIHVPGQPVRTIDRTGSLEGGDILPGFSLALADVFAER